MMPVVTLEELLGREANAEISGGEVNEIDNWLSKDTLSSVRSLLWLPTQHRFASCGSFVEAADARVVRCIDNEFRIFLSLAGYRSHGVDKLI